MAEYDHGYGTSVQAQAGNRQQRRPWRLRRGGFGIGMRLKPGAELQLRLQLPRSNTTRVPACAFATSKPPLELPLAIPPHPEKAATRGGPARNLVLELPTHMHMPDHDRPFRTRRMQQKSKNEVPMPAACTCLMAYILMQMPARHIIQGRCSVNTQ